MDLNKELVIIPVSHITDYEDYDQADGYGGEEQIFIYNNIVVLKEKEQEFREHVKQFENQRITD